MSTTESALTGKVAVALEPLFMVPIVAPEAIERFGALGYERGDWWERYFAFRSAPMGRVSADTVIATYYNFSPRRIRKYIPHVWEIAEPDAVIDALMESVALATGRALADFSNSGELLELTSLVRHAALDAYEHPEGRALFAGIASIPWPMETGAELWLGMHALREFRGDGHVAVLLAEGVSGLEASVLQVAYRKIPDDILRTSRAWSRDQWGQAVDDLRGRGLLLADEVVLSEAGLTYRRELEARTHELALPAFRTIGDDGMRRILELAPPIVTAVTTAVGQLTLDQVIVRTDD